MSDNILLTYSEKDKIMDLMNIHSTNKVKELFKYIESLLNKTFKEKFNETMYNDNAC